MIPAEVTDADRETARKLNVHTAYSDIDRIAQAIADARAQGREAGIREAAKVCAETSIEAYSYYNTDDDARGTLSSAEERILALLDAQQGDDKP